MAWERQGSIQGPRGLPGENGSQGPPGNTGPPGPPGTTDWAGITNRPVIIQGLTGGTLPAPQSFWVGTETEFAAATKSTSTIYLVIEYQ